MRGSVQLLHWQRSRSRVLTSRSQHCAFALFFAAFCVADIPAHCGPDALLFGRPGLLEQLVRENAEVTVTPADTLKLQFMPAGTARVRFPAGILETSDWSAFGALALELRNTDPDRPIKVTVRIRSAAPPDKDPPAISGVIDMDEGERGTWLVPLPGAAPGMSSSAPIDPTGNVPTISMSGAHDLIAGRIIDFEIAISSKDARAIELSGAKLWPKPDLHGIVDEFGQFSRVNWPGKLESESEFPVRAAEEQTWLKNHPPAVDRDEFGGWKSGPQFEATGFFHTIQHDGKWWLVTPAGHLFFSLGVTCIEPHAATRVTGREDLFTRLPDATNDRGIADFYANNLRRKYGADWIQDWTRITNARLASWGVNTVAAWSDAAFMRSRVTPYTVQIHLRLDGVPFISAGDHVELNHSGRLPDFFHSSFPALVEKQIEEDTAEWRNDPLCIGFFVDNELAWGDGQNGKPGDQRVAREALGAPPALPSRKVFVALLQQKYGNIEAFNQAWQTYATSWDEPVWLESSQLTPAAYEDCSMFLTKLSERYFTTVANALKQYVPNQLYLGCRFSVRPSEVVAVAARQCDVVSFNVYQNSLDEKAWAFTDNLGRPCLIGEFHFGAADRGLFHGGIVTVRSQARRGSMYTKYIQSVLARPSFVGAHWFQYVDQALTGRPGDGEQGNCGIVSITDTPYPELRDAMRETNNQIYAGRARTRGEKATQSQEWKSASPGHLP